MGIYLFYNNYSFALNSLPRHPHVPERYWFITVLIKVYGFIIVCCARTRLPSTVGPVLVRGGDRGPSDIPGALAVAAAVVEESHRRRAHTAGRRSAHHSPYARVSAHTTICRSRRRRRRDPTVVNEIRRRCHDPPRRPPQPDGMNRGRSVQPLRAAAAAAAAVVAAVSLLSRCCCTPAAALAYTASADVLPDGEVEIRASAGNVTAKRTSFASPDTGWVAIASRPVISKGLLLRSGRLTGDNSDRILKSILDSDGWSESNSISCRL